MRHKLSGLSVVPKVRTSRHSCCDLVGERSKCSEAHGASRSGAFGSENVGTSNHKSGEIPDHRKPKVSLAMSISQGLVGPKPMAKAGGNGQLVNIPALRIFLMTGRNLVHRSYYWIYVHGIRACSRKIRNTAFNRAPNCFENPAQQCAGNLMEQVSKKSV